MRIFTVGFVYADEATPREEHFTTVKADNSDEAQLFVWVEAFLRGDRVMTTGVMTEA